MVIGDFCLEYCVYNGIIMILQRNKIISKLLKNIKGTDRLYKVVELSIQCCGKLL